MRTERLLTSSFAALCLICVFALNASAQTLPFVRTYGSVSNGDLVVFWGNDGKGIASAGSTNFGTLFGGLNDRLETLEALGLLANSNRLQYLETDAARTSNVWTWTQTSNYVGDSIAAIPSVDISGKLESNTWTAADPTTNYVRRDTGTTNFAQKTGDTFSGKLTVLNGLTVGGFGDFGSSETNSEIRFYNADQGEDNYGMGCAEDSLWMNSWVGRVWWWHIDGGNEKFVIRGMIFGDGGGLSNIPPDGISGGGAWVTNLSRSAMASTSNSLYASITNASAVQAASNAAMNAARVSTSNSLFSAIVGTSNSLSAQDAANSNSQAAVNASISADGLTYAKVDGSRAFTNTVTILNSNQLLSVILSDTGVTNSGAAFFSDGRWNLNAVNSDTLTNVSHLSVQIGAPYNIQATIGPFSTGSVWFSIGGVRTNFAFTSSVNVNTTIIPTNSAQFVVGLAATSGQINVYGITLRRYTEENGLIVQGAAQINGAVMGTRGVFASGLSVGGSNVVTVGSAVTGLTFSAFSPTNPYSGDGPWEIVTDGTSTWTVSHGDEGGSASNATTIYYSGVQYAGLVTLSNSTTASWAMDASSNLQVFVPGVTNNAIGIQNVGLFASNALASRAPLVTNPVYGCVQWFDGTSWLRLTNMLYDATNSNFNFFWNSTNCPSAGAHFPKNGEQAN